MHMDNFPSLSIITPTLNNGRDIGAFLEGIRNQDYPQDKIEILIVDGGSTDDTLSFARKYRATIYPNDRVLAEPGVDLGIQKAKGDILMVLAVDNLYSNKGALATLIKAFENPKVYAALPKQDSGATDSMYTKYTNVFTDPFNHFVYGYAANARTFHKIYTTLEHNDLYDVYDFSSQKIKPIIALAQGFSMRRGFVKRERNEMDDIQPILDLIGEGRQIAYVHSVSLYHHTIKDLRHFMRKQRWAARNALAGERYGINSRANVLTPGQKVKARLFPLYSLTIVIPCINSVYHWIKDGESLWLFHPFISFVSGVSIAYEYAKIKLGFRAVFSRN